MDGGGVAVAFGREAAETFGVEGTAMGAVAVSVGGGGEEDEFVGTLVVVVIVWLTFEVVLTTLKGLDLPKTDRGLED